MATNTSNDEDWAELADLALIIAREIQFRDYADERAVPLTQSEGMVMRHLQTHPAAAPSSIADATGLLRTNLSAVLRGLERKGLIERHGSGDDARTVSVHLTDRGRTNYALVRGEWAQAVRTAAGGDTTHLRATLTLLRQVETGLTGNRPSRR